MNNEYREFLDKVNAFLAARSTMTLATVDGEGRPQAAAVFFAAEADGSLVFVSGAKSRHGLNIEANGRGRNLGLS
jgi:pyridoxine/pyridoxamine 5'-phosphate oxidase